jgi:hypothetical protein
MGWILFCCVLYFLPAIFAASRKHRNDLAICATNLLLGWTILGWVGALIWSLTANVREQGLDGRWR